LRESPIVILAEALLGKGFELRIYDRNVSIARLVGANKEYINKQIPHLSSLLCERIDEVLDHSDVIVVGNNAPEFAEALKRTKPEQMVVDLVRVAADRSEIPGQYQGICW
jgi:GDP-mannose 6-dehydrogenase